MVTIFTVLMPVLLVVYFGWMMRRRNLLCEKTVEELKYLLTNNILPVAIFHALATAHYTSQSWTQAGLMLVILFVSFAAGYLMKPLVKQPFRKYVPFLVSLYEGGMVAYPLYAKLCGSENIHRIAVLDIAAILFAFGFYMNMLAFEESGEKADFKKGVIRALKTPAFDASLLGILFGVSGVMTGFLATGAGQVYIAAVQTIVDPLTTMILMVVGYNLQADRELLVPCLKTIGLRIVMQAAMIFLMLFGLHRLEGPDPLRDKAILIFMSAPPTYSLQSFIKDPKGANYASTVNALYIFVSIAVFAAASLLM